jgi:hypothetical protein
MRRTKWNHIIHKTLKLNFCQHDIILVQICTSLFNRVDFQMIDLKRDYCKLIFKARDSCLKFLSFLFLEGRRESSNKPKFDIVNVNKFLQYSPCLNYQNLKNYLSHTKQTSTKMNSFFSQRLIHSEFTCPFLQLSLQGSNQEAKILMLNHNSQSYATK